MNSNTADAGGAPLPPAITRTTAPPAAESDAALAPVPPFVPGRAGLDAAREAIATGLEAAAARAADAAIAGDQAPKAQTDAAQLAAADTDAARVAAAETDADTADSAETDADQAGADVFGGDRWPHLQEQGAAMPAWDDGSADEASAARTERPAAAFPLDAFFVPEHSRRVPAGYDEAEHREMAERLAGQLEALAGALRQRGMLALAGPLPGAAPLSGPSLGAASPGGSRGTDELGRLIAAVVAGYYAREPE
jgi:hypothetical protein